MIEAFGETKSINAWAKDPRCVPSAAGLYKRLAAGEPPEDALTRPAKTAGSSQGRTGLTFEAFGETKTMNAWASDPRCQVSRTALRRRIADGMTMQEALDLGPQTPPTYTVFGETKGLVAWHQDPRCVVSYEVLHRRVIHENVPLHEAMTTPARPPRPPAEPKPPAGHEAFGEHKSLLQWSRDPRCMVGERTLRSRHREGMDLETALTTPTVRMIEAFGETKPVAAWASDPRCVVTSVTIAKRIDEGWDPEQAITTRGAVLVEAFGESKTITAWANDPRCTVPAETIRARIHDGIPAEAAISKPPPSPALYEAFGEAKPLSGWVTDPRSKIKETSTLHSRIHKIGLPVEEALTTDLLQRESIAQRDLGAFVESLNAGDVLHSIRGVIGRLELDIYVPDRQVAIEYNGVYWHSEIYAGRHRHAEKADACTDAGIQLIQVWEDDWRDRRPIVEASIAHKLGASTQPRLPARQCTVDLNVPKHEAAQFLTQHHIQGSTAATIRVGLRHNSRLVALGAFKAVNGGTWDLVRYATSAVVAGGFTRILTRFRRTHPGAIKTFADRCISDGGLYEAAGFTADAHLPPDYAYLVNDTRVHKFNYRKARFAKDPHLLYDPTMTEAELAALNGLTRIWDAGKTRYTLP